ncbi:MAG: hypothetical protein ACI8P3_001299 [Saprospiraceae bacterium]
MSFAHFYKKQVMVQEIGKAKGIRYKIGVGKIFPVSLETA